MRCNQLHRLSGMAFFVISAIFLTGNAYADSSACTRAVQTEASSEFGDLSYVEVAEIQAVVDLLGREVVVVGSAAKKSRRRPTDDVPIAKGEDGKSDIDYLLPMTEHKDERIGHAFVEKNISLFSRLPAIDRDKNTTPESPWRPGVIVWYPSTEMPRIWFRPQTPPMYYGPSTPNPALQPWPHEK